MTFRISLFCSSRFHRPDDTITNSSGRVLAVHAVLETGAYLNVNLG